MTAARNDRQKPSTERSKQARPPRSPRARRNAPTSASRTSTQAVVGIKMLVASSNLIEIKTEEGAVYLAKRGEVGQLDPLVGLVHCQPDKAKLGDWTIGLNKPRVGSAAGCAELGRPA